MTKYVGKMLLLNSKRVLRKLQKILGGHFFATPCSIRMRRIDTFWLYDIDRKTSLVRQSVIIRLHHVSLLKLSGRL